MARLNEAPCASESVDALKRRFIRQNRELAKANSTQTVRIRCLEAEISRLRAGNLNLRDEILQLRNDLAGTCTRRAFGGVQLQLQVQVDVLAKLIAGIGLPKEVSKSVAPENRRYPTVGWGRGQGDPLDGTDGRLPAIHEDKSYPRRTLDQTDIQVIAETSSESPAIGSPPVSHFQDEEPIKYDAPSTTESTKDNDEAPLPANLETRRKKRESSTKLSIRRMSVFSSPEDEAKDNTINGQERPAVQVLPVRAGAKRKLGSRDDNVTSASDFRFGRKTSGTCDSNEESGVKEEKVREPVKAFSRRDSVRPATYKLAERTALGEKSINIDPVVSPTKIARGASFKQEKDVLKKEIKSVEEPVKARTNRDRRSRVTVDDGITIVPSQELMSQATEMAEFSQPETEVENETKADLPPKTPFASGDTLSAPSTECSAPATGRYTPPPGDFGASADVNGRPGRRARAQVNYAEPSLTAKMRRPTKELLDAVGKDGRPQKGMIVRKDANGVEIKVEEGAGSASKEMLAVLAASRMTTMEEPGSPLSKKSEIPEALIAIQAEPESILPSAASQAIAALIKDSKTSAAAAAARRKSAGYRTASAETELRKDRHGSSIYDFASSSPPRSTKPSSRPSSTSSDRDADENASARPGSRGSSRRHSSVPSLAMPATKVEGARVVPRFGSAVANHKRTVGGQVASSVLDTEARTVDLRTSRRRSMML